MISTVKIKSLDDLTLFSEKIIHFLSKPLIEGSFYHHPAYIEQIILTQSNIVSWIIILLLEADEIIAIIPLYVTKEPFALRLGVIKIISIRLRKLKFFGNKISYDHNYSSVNLQKSLEEALVCYSENYDIGLLDGMSTDSIIMSCFSDKKNPIRIESISKRPQSVWILSLSGSWDDYFLSMKRKKRYNLKSCVHKLSKKNEGKLHLERYRHVDDVIPFLSALDKIYRQTWQAYTFGHKNRNNKEDQAKNTILAKIGVLDSFVLYCSGEAVAFLRGYQYNGTYFYEEIGYKQSMRDDNPGTVLNMLVFPMLFTDGNIKILDFGYGENVYKQVFGNKNYAAVNALLVRNYSFGAILLRVQQGFQRFYETVRYILAALKLDSLARALLKKQK